MSLDRNTIIDIIRPLIDEAENFQDDLGDIREELYQRYRAEPYGNEEEGWASSVDPVIWDTVQGLIPSLMSTYTDNWYQLSGPSTERSTADGRFGRGVIFLGGGPDRLGLDQTRQHDQPHAHGYRQGRQSRGREKSYLPHD